MLTDYWFNYNILSIISAWLFCVIESLQDITETSFDWASIKTVTYFCVVLYFRYILLTCKKAAEALYIGNWLPQPAFGDAEILLSDHFFLNRVIHDCIQHCLLNLKAEEIVAKCLSQGHNNMNRAGLLFFKVAQRIN